MRKHTMTWKAEVREGKYLYIVRVEKGGDIVWELSDDIPWDWRRLLIASLEENFISGSIAYLPFIQVKRVSSIVEWEEDE